LATAAFADGDFVRVDARPHGLTGDVDRRAHGFRGNASAGLCIAGNSNNCPNTFPDFGVEGLYGLAKGDFAVAASAGILAFNMSPAARHLASIRPQAWREGQIHRRQALRAVPAERVDRDDRSWHLRVNYKM
jgi:hypothetical protein